MSSSYERVKEIVEDLQAEGQGLDGLDVEKAKAMLLKSECLTAALHAYLFRNEAGYEIHQQ